MTVLLTAASRKRKRATAASFCCWAVRHDLLGANPMDKIDTVKVPRTLQGLAGRAPRKPPQTCLDLPRGQVPKRPLADLVSERGQRIPVNLPRAS